MKLDMLYRENTPATTTLYHGQQLYRLLSPSKLPVKGYSTETHFC